VKAKALYGFTPNLEPFQGKSPAEQIDLLRSWGNTALFGGYQDPALVEAAHAAELPVYAEFGCFVGQRWWHEVPGSRPVTAQGAPLEPEEWYYGVNPSSQPVRKAQLEAFEILLTEHTIDGVWLDFIRWPCHWESPNPHLPHTSFDPHTLAQFAQDTGFEVPLQPPSAAAESLLGAHSADWVAWRCSQVTSWVAQARQLLDRVRPGALLGLFGVPWRQHDLNGAILEIVGQDYAALGPYVDVFSPMVYHRMCGQPPSWIADVTQEVHALSGKPVWPIVQSVAKPSPFPPQEYRRALEIALDAPASQGVLVFNLQGALNLGANLRF
jgi:hypothetical protein